jgi:hypothetical protein
VPTTRAYGIGYFSATMTDDPELPLPIPSSMIRRVRRASQAITEADAQIAQANDRGERLAAEGDRASAERELLDAQLAIVRLVLALASKHGV